MPEKLAVIVPENARFYAQALWDSFSYRQSEAGQPRTESFQ
jgi:hypothetical protein